jgi:hypothetical protein
MALTEEQIAQQETAAATAAGEKRWRESGLARLAEVEVEMRASTHPLYDIANDVREGHRHKQDEF